MKNQTKRKNKSHKGMKLPEKYKTGFLTKLDQRSRAFLMLNSAYQEVLSDIGGVEGLSHVKLAMVDRFVFLEFVMRRLEYRIAKHPKKNMHLIGKWVQAINSLTGLARIIGLERKAKRVKSLQVYARGEEE